MDIGDRNRIDREYELIDLTQHVDRCLSVYGREFVMNALVDALQAQQGAEFPKAVYAFASELCYQLGAGAFERLFPGNNAMKDDKGREGTS